MQLLDVAKEWHNYNPVLAPIQIPSTPPNIPISYRKDHCKHCNWDSYVFTKDDHQLILNNTFSRNHKASDWHRFNVNLLQTNTDVQPLTYDAFTAFAKDNAAQCPYNMSLVDFLTLQYNANVAIQCTTTYVKQTNLPKLHFVNSKSGVQIGIWKCILQKALKKNNIPPNQNRITTTSNADISMQELTESYMDFGNAFLTSKWLLFLCGGGYFASAVFSNASATPIVHKSFHRYTVRKGQGGSQSLKDASKRCHSAGSSLRRYNEIALIEDIQSTFRSWQASMYLNDVQCVFFNTTAGNKSILAVSCLREVESVSFPFTTYRASYEEILRCYQILTDCSAVE